MAFNRAILRTYAGLSSPEIIPPHVYFEHSDHTITIFDAYPKAFFHFLILPRLQANSPLTAANLTSLKTFINSSDISKRKAIELLRRVKEDAEHLRSMIKEEMLSRFGFIWNVQMGFHAVQSMDHIHLHVISQDLCVHASGMKTNKHYNSFHPKLGFFLHLDEVISWFNDDCAESYFQSMIGLKESTYEKFLKEPLECLHCGKEQKNMPQLKLHLQEHFDKLSTRKKADTKKKQKRERSQSREEKVGEQNEKKSEGDSDIHGDLTKRPSSEREITPEHQSNDPPRKKKKNV
ncbi:hypothetical protein DFH11DRAFT_1137440 [Phellopilus nigrolimitatus]|nr:hypothetical protein DFH11DRAFT_1137440 [Phellopilus nigrolimitatus]